VSDAAVRAGDLVLDLGAGEGMLTRPLVEAGARVVAVEIDRRSCDVLRTRFPAVDVECADITALAWPDEPFAVVANLPFAVGTAVLRSLLDDPRVKLRGADAIVEWGLAAKRAAVWPSTLTSVFWGAWYELALTRRLPRSCFAPTPSVDAALLRIRRRAEPLVPIVEAPAYRAFLRTAFGDRRVPHARRFASELGFDPHAHGRDLDARQWASLYLALRSARRRRAAAAPTRRPS
jgi:23S rRNA (adenine-N6)-dimethyltransferase